MCTECNTECGTAAMFNILMSLSHCGFKLKSDENISLKGTLHPFALSFVLLVTK